MRTLTELTATTICNEINKSINNLDLKYPIEIIIKGGGAKNIFLIELLRTKLEENIAVILADELGIDVDLYEATAFAFLGFLTLNGLQGNIPKSTGAERGVVLGSISKNF
jgi:anhydro-N-acetylmuramic acid kinase